MALEAAHLIREIRDGEQGDRIARYTIPLLPRDRELIRRGHAAVVLRLVLEPPELRLLLLQPTFHDEEHAWDPTEISIAQVPLLVPR